MVDHHDVAGDAHFVAMRRRIADLDRGDQARIGRVGHVNDRGAEILLVRNVRDVSVVAGNGDLPAPGRSRWPRRRTLRAAAPLGLILLIFIFLRSCAYSIVAPEAFTIAVHFGISALI